MSSQTIENAILESIDILTQRALDTAGFDKTIQAIIKNCENKALGKYTVKYQDSQFFAYATSPETTYSNNTLVYVHVPNGNFEKDKTILGAVSQLGEDYITPIDNDYFDAIGSNFLNVGQYALQSYRGSETHTIYNYNISSTANRIIDVNAIAEYIKDSKFLQLKATVRTDLAEEQKQGYYALEVIIEFNDSNGGTVDRTYRLSTNQMIGNPYKLFSPVIQSYVYTIDGANFVRIKEIKLVTNGFDTNGVLKDDIFFTNIIIQAVEPLEFSNDGKLSLSVKAPYGTITNGTSPSKIELEATIKSKGAVYAKDVEYRWFVENAKIGPVSDKYDSFAGVGWEWLNPATGNKKQTQLSINASDITASVVRYKCIVIVDDAILTKTVKVYNTNIKYALTITSNNGTYFHQDDGTFNLTATLRNNGTIVNSGFTYYWYMMNNEGYCTNYSGSRTSLTGLRVKDIVNFAIFYCNAFDSNGKLVATAEIMIQNGTEVGKKFSLIIKNGTKMFKYNTKGIAPNDQSIPESKQIKPQELYFEVYNPNGECVFDSSNTSYANKIPSSGIHTYWKFPDSNTLLTQSMTGAAAAGGYITLKDSPKFIYNIEKRYKATSTRNNIELIVEYSDGISDHRELLYASTNFIFTKEGNNGTNGTDYSAIIKRNTEWEYTVDVYKDGILQTGSDITYEWSILTGDIKQQRYAISMGGASRTVTLTTDAYYSTALNSSIATNDILQVKIGYGSGNYYLYACYPIVSVKMTNSSYTLRLKEGTGFREVTYEPDNTNPAYDYDNAFEIEVVRRSDNTVISLGSSYFSWGKIGSIKRGNVVSNDNILTLAETNGNKTKVKVAEKYNGSITSAIYCVVNGYGSIKIPIYLCTDRYSNAALTGWDGNSININNNDKYFLAPQIGAGKKEDDNTFTGILMGTQISSSEETKIGLFGYNKGRQTLLLDAETGEARFKDVNSDFEIVLTPSSDTRNRKKPSLIGLNGQDYYFNPTDYIALSAGNGFFLTAEGTIYATRGILGGFEIGADYIKTEDDSGSTQMGKSAILIRCQKRTTSGSLQYPGRMIQLISNEYGSSLEVRNSGSRSDITNISGGNIYTNYIGVGISPTGSISNSGQLNTYTLVVRNHLYVGTNTAGTTGSNTNTEQVTVYGKTVLGTSSYTSTERLRIYGTTTLGGTEWNNSNRSGVLTVFGTTNLGQRYNSSGYYSQDTSNVLNIYGSATIGYGSGTILSSTLLSVYGRVYFYENLYANQSNTTAYFNYIQSGSIYLNSYSYIQNGNYSLYCNYNSYFNDDVTINSSYILSCGNITSSGQVQCNTLYITNRDYIQNQYVGLYCNWQAYFNDNVTIANSYTLSCGKIKTNDYDIIMGNGDLDCDGSGYFGGTGQDYNSGLKVENNLAVGNDIYASSCFVRMWFATNVYSIDDYYDGIFIDDDNVYNYRHYSPCAYAVWQSGSDKRFKDNIQTLNSSLTKDILQSCNFISFNYNSYARYDNDLHYGVIAQELLQVLEEKGIHNSHLVELMQPPTLPFDNKNEQLDSYYIVNYTEFIGLMGKAIQDLYLETDRLKKLLEAKGE